ncbi:MAG: hypothetical protein SNJ68_02070 [Cyanobacteriota bacterium]
MVVPHQPTPEVGQDPLNFEMNRSPPSSGSISAICGASMPWSRDP